MTTKRKHSKHDIRDTTLDAYEKIKKSLGERQQEVFDLINKQPGLTDNEIARRLGYADPNKVRPRRFELMELRLIEEGEKRPCSISNRKALTWFPI